MSNQNNNNNVPSQNSGINARGPNAQQSARAAMLQSLSRLTQQQIQQLVAKYSKLLELANQAPPSSDIQKQHLAKAGKIKEILMNYSQLQKLKQQQQSNNNNKSNNANNNVSSANSISNNNNSKDSNSSKINAAVANNVTNKDDTAAKSTNNSSNDKVSTNPTADGMKANNNDTTNISIVNQINNDNNNNNNNANAVGSQNSIATRPPLSGVEKSQSQSNLANAPLMIQVQHLKRLSFIYQEHQKKLRSYKSFMERPNLTPETVNRLKLEATQVQQKMEQIKLASLKLSESLRQNRVNLSTLAQRQNTTNNNAGNSGFSTDSASNDNNITSPGSNTSNPQNSSLVPGSSPTIITSNNIPAQNTVASPGIISQVSTPKTPVVAPSAAATPNISAASTFNGAQPNSNTNSNTATSNFTIPPAVLAKIQSSASVFIQQILAKGSVTLGGQEVNLNTMSPQNKVAFIKQISARYQQQQINALKQRHLQQQANGGVSLANASNQQQQQLLNQIMASNTMTPQQKAQILQRLQSSQRAVQQPQSEGAPHPSSPAVTAASIRNNQVKSLPKEEATDNIINNSKGVNINKNPNIQGLAVQVPNSIGVGNNGIPGSAPGTPSVPVTPHTATSEAAGGIGSSGKRRLASVNGSAKSQPLGKLTNPNAAKVLKKSESKKLKKMEGVTANTSVPLSSSAGNADAILNYKGSISTSSMNNGSGSVGQKQHPTVSYNNGNKTVEKLKFNTVTENGRQQLFIHQGKMKRKIADLDLKIPEEETVTSKTNDFVASWKKHFMHSIPLTSYRKTAHIRGILNTPKYLQLPEVFENEQKNLDDSGNSASTFISGGVGIGGNNSLEGTGSGIAENRAEGDLIAKSKLKELIQSVNPNISIDGDVEDILLEISDEFIHNLCRFSCNLAKRRRTDSIQVKDIQLHLDRFYNIKIPGFDSDEIRNIRKWAPTSGYLNKISGVEVSRSVDRQEK